MENKNANFSTKKKIRRIIIIAVIIAAVVAAAYFTLKYTGVLEKFDSAEKIRDFILSGGAWSRVIYMVLQFLQVTFVPLPAMLTTIAGTLVFGPWETVFMSIAAIMLGRIFAFWLGRKFGMPLVKWMVGQDDAEKWSQVLGRGKYTYFLMLLFPAFPDDILCIIAGITTITWPFYLTANIITVIISCFTMCFLTSGQLIPFSGWGIPVWIALGVLLIAAIILSFKYKDKIESFVTNLGARLSRKKQSDQPDGQNENNESENQQK